MFNHSRGVSITGGAHNVVYGNQFNKSVYNADDSTSEVLNFVTTRAALNAIHNSEQRFPPPNCLPGTRREILAECHRWIMEQHPSKRVLWIHGPAGVGKSAIMQKVSESYACQGKLLVGTQWPWHVCMRNQARRNTCHRFAASFFFSRNDPTRSKLDRFVATIVYQFLTSEPLREVLGPAIIQAIRSNPGVFRLSFEDQFRKLILEPCSGVGQSVWKNLPNVLIIDGLDECVLVPSQERLIAMIREAIPYCPLLFLLASRPEPRICRALENEMFASSLRRLTIGNSDESTRDITAYLRMRFSRLRKTHPSLRCVDASWPGEDVIRKLVIRACGQFIFAVTVMKYLESDDEEPTERLEDILRIRADDLPESPYPDLDLLYRQILGTCSRWTTIRKVLRLIISMPTIKINLIQAVSSYFTRSPECIAAILGYKPGKVQNLLFKLHAVLEVPEDDSHSIHIPHASFTEFLLDPTRSKDFHIRPLTKSKYHDLLARAFLRVISVFSLQYRVHISHSTLIDRKAWVFLYPNFSLFSVFRLILSVKESPSEELLAALDKFDPYPYATRLLNWKTVQWPDIGDFESWRDTIQWAKALGNRRAPRVFLSRMETFLRSFYIGSLQATNFQLCSVMAFLEAALYIPRSAMNLPFMYSWPQIFYNKGPGDVYILPAEQGLPPSWNGVLVTQERGTKMARLLVPLAMCDANDLINDIHKGTYTSVSNPPKIKELHALKKLVVQRQLEFGIDPYPCSPPFGMAEAILYGVVNSFRQCFQVQSQQDSTARFGDKEANETGVPRLLHLLPESTNAKEATPGFANGVHMVEGNPRQ